MQKLAEIFKNTFDPYFNAPIQIWETFAEGGQVIKTAKNEVIKKYGEQEKYFYFILKGSGADMGTDPNSGNPISISTHFLGTIFYPFQA